MHYTRLTVYCVKYNYLSKYKSSKVLGKDNIKYINNMKFLQDKNFYVLTVEI